MIPSSMRFLQISALCFAFVLMSFGVLGNAAPVFACSCAEVTPNGQLTNATAVFVGTVENISVVGRDHVVEFNVSESRKGVVGEMITVTTAGNEAMCGYSFVEGQEYIVYAYGEVDQLSTGLCTGTSGYIPSAGGEDGGAASGSLASSTDWERVMGSLSILLVLVAFVAFGAGGLVVYSVTRK